MDSKTKYFLDSIDYLINKGVIKNHQAVVNELDWNKSVMSSVRKGAMPVPQHIYNKFKQVFENELVEQDNPDSKNQDIMQKYIEQLEKNNAILEKSLAQMEVRLRAVDKAFEQIEIMKGYLNRFEKSHQDIRASLDEIAENQFLFGAVQQGWQEYWSEHLPSAPPTPLREVKEMIRIKVISLLHSYEQEGKQAVLNQDN